MHYIREKKVCKYKWRMAVSALMEITHFFHNLLIHGTGSSKEQLS